MKQQKISLRILTQSQVYKLAMGLQTMDSERLFIIDQNNQLRGSLAKSKWDLPCLYKKNYGVCTTGEIKTWSSDNDELEKSDWDKNDKNLQSFKQWIYEHLSRQEINNLMRLALEGNQIARQLMQE